MYHACTNWLTIHFGHRPVTKSVLRTVALPRFQAFRDIFELATDLSSSYCPKLGWLRESLLTVMVHSITFRFSHKIESILERTLKQGQGHYQI